MQVFKIPEAIADQYKGCGHAVAFVDGEEIKKIFYVRDIWPGVNEEDAEMVKAAFFDSFKAPTVNTPYLGMCSRWEFCAIAKKAPHPIFNNAITTVEI